jgi:hypothetical protein
MWLVFTDTMIRIVEVLLVKPFILPFKIYKKSIKNLSSHIYKEDTEVDFVKEDFQILVYLTEVYDSLIVLSYPIGVIFTIYMSLKTNFDYSFGFYQLTISLVLFYFSPIFISFPKEILNIILKNLNFLGIISKK